MGDRQMAEALNDEALQLDEEASELLADSFNHHHSKRCRMQVEAKELRTSAKAIRYEANQLRQTTWERLFVYAARKQLSAHQFARIKADVEAECPELPWKESDR